MAVFSAEQFEEFLSAVMRMAGGGEGGAGQPPGLGEGRGRPLVAKHVRCDSFQGGAWDDWAFAFKRSIRSQSSHVFRCMQRIETAEDELDEETELPQEMEPRSGELYDILCQHCKGEALGVVRATKDMRGFEAWQKLHRKYNPRTMARGVRLLAEAVGPNKVKELRDVETAVHKWEEKLKVLESQFGEEIGENMRIAIFTNMLPAAVQDHIYTTIVKGTKYDELRDKIQAFIGNKLAVNMGPAPMDVGEVWWQAGDAEGGDNHDDLGVDAVWPTSQCHRCGGFGHFARECATPKGGGKGGDAGGKGDFEKGKGKGFDKGGFKGGFSKGMGKGKGFGKDFTKGGFKGGGGGGKGYQGTCWKCGKIGHTSAECNTAAAGAVEAEEAEERADCCQVEMGGVWLIGNVESRRESIEVHNQFEVLGQEEDDGEKEVGFEECTSEPPEPPTVGEWPARVRKRTCRGGGRCGYGSCREAKEEVEVDEVVAVNAVEDRTWTRLSGLMFNVAEVKKPLAAAAKIVEAGNRVILDPNPDKCFIENVDSKERMRLRKERGVYVIDAKFEAGGEGVITLDSGAGVSVWPKDMLAEVPMMPKKKGLKMMAANGTEIANIGQNMIKFQGLQGCGEDFRRRQ